MRLRWALAAGALAILAGALAARDLGPEPAAALPAPAAGAEPAPPVLLPAEAPQQALPVYLLRLPERVPAALVFDLEANSLHVYRNHRQRLEADETFYVSIGKNGGFKQQEGDEKTPVGLYFVSGHLPGERLPPIYGAGALPLSYPNAWDRLLGRTGSGIWIHGTDREDGRLPARSSRGCLTLDNDSFRYLASGVAPPQTPVILTESVEWASPLELARDRDRVLGLVETWRRDWQSLDTERYLDHYSASFRARGYDLARWSSHKRRVNAGKKFIAVDVSDLAAYRYPGEPDLRVVTFNQRYSSSNYNARSFKHQYWRREDGGWRIIYEGSG